MKKARARARGAKEPLQQVLPRLEHTTELSMFILMKYIAAMLLTLAVLHQFPSLTLDIFFIKMFMIVSWKHTLMSTTTTMIGLHLAINTLMMWESYEMLQRILIKISPHLNSNRSWITSAFTTKLLIKQQEVWQPQ